MFKNDKKHLTEQELQTESQRVFQEKLAKANKEINAILEKYGLTMVANNVIQFIPKQV